MVTPEWSLRHVQWIPALNRASWGSVVVAILYGVATALLGKLATPRSMFILPNDPRFSYPMNPNSISNGGVIAVCFGAWIVYGLVVEFLLLRKTNRNLTICVFSFFCIFFRMLELYLLNVCIEQTIAYWVGYQRPDYYARCDPEPGTVSCRSTNISEIEDGQRAFYSGHASTSTVVMVYMAIYLSHAWYYRKHHDSLSQPGVIVRRTSTTMSVSSLSSRVDKSMDKGPRRSHISPQTVWNVNGISGWIITEVLDGLVFFFMTLPIWACLLISTTRVIDNRHARMDIAFGDMIGAMTAIVFFPRYQYLTALGTKELSDITRVRVPYIEPDNQDNQEIQPQQEETRS